MKSAGIENILALRGDIPKNYEGEVFTDFSHASELVKLIKESGDFCVGGACYPEVHPDSANRKEDILGLKRKVDAGCEYLTTQMFLTIIYFQFHVQAQGGRHNCSYYSRNHADYQEGTG